MTRDAGPGDADAIAQIEAIAGDTRWSPGAVADTLAQPSTRAFVAVEDGIVGHLLASSAAGVGELLTVAVHPEHRRAGHGRALLTRCHDRWKRDGVEEAFLEVRDSNRAARDLYAAHGWTHAGTRPGYYADGDDALVMRWVP